jgi:hypothetical protein
MKQKLFFLALALLFLSVTSMNAQVQIGGTAGPNASAILDLNPDEGDATLGLKLPVIALGDVSVFQLSETAEDADGITVYNSNDETIGGNGKGIYVWEEDKWVFTGKSGQITPVAVPVTRITITSADDATTVRAGSSLQLTAIVEPDAPSNATLNWSIVYDAAATAGSATIDSDGNLTAVKTGNVTARATATDGSGVYGNFTITVKPTDYVSTITVRSVTGQTTLKADKTLQLVADVEPSSASHVVDWSIASGSEYGTISPSGVLSGKSAGGPVVVSALATDGSGIEDVTFTATITEGLVLTVVNQQIGDGFYDTYDYNGAVWMVQNSYEGSPTYNYYEPGHYEMSYYNQIAAPTACPDGWHLPSLDEFTALIGYLWGPWATAEELLPWTSYNNLTGALGANTPNGTNWGVRGAYRGADNACLIAWPAPRVWDLVPDGNDNWGASSYPYQSWTIRCVQE